MVSNFQTIDRWLAAVDAAERSAKGDMARLANILRGLLLTEMTLRDAAPQPDAMPAPPRQPLAYPLVTQ